MAILRVDPFDCQMPFPLDSRMQQPTLNERDGIPMNARWVGMTCWVQSENTLYILIGGTANINWQQLWPLGSAGVAVQNVTVNTNVPTSQGVNGDIWFRQNGSDIEVYQKTAETWNIKGVLISGGDTESIEDSSLTLDETSATLNSLYPDMAVGGIVYNEAIGVSYTRKSPTKWVMEYFI